MKNRTLLFVSFGVLVASAILGRAYLPLATELLAAETGLDARALKLQRQLLLVDTHVDTPTHALEFPDWDFFARQSDTHVDLVRLRESGVDAPFMVVYSPSRLKPDDALVHALAMCDVIHGWAESRPSMLTIARTPAEVRAARADGKIGMVVCMENGSPILPGRLELLRDFYRLGIRYIGLCHFKTNHLCDSATDDPVHDGVSAFGRRVVEESNRLGIILDVSHISDDSVRDLLRYSKAPIVASHSNARARCDHARNLPDDLIHGIAASGGVIQLNFAAQYLSPAYLDEHTARKKRLRPSIEAIEHEFADDPARVRKEVRKLRKQEPEIPRPGLEYWFRHLDHIVELVGVDHVGLGSDLDGVGAMPRGIDDVTSLTVLTRGLLERGWSEENIAKFYGGNFMRCWEMVEKVGVEIRSGTRPTSGSED